MTAPLHVSRDVLALRVSAEWVFAAAVLALRADRMERFRYLDRLGDELLEAADEQGEHERYQREAEECSTTR